MKATWIVCGLLSVFLGQASAQEPEYRIATSTRLVVEDVSVVDAKGNPVTHLPQTAFHVTDDGRPQTLNSFAEADSGGTGKAAKLAPGSYGNAELFENQGTVLVFLVDPIGMELPDQMFLRLQMLKYIKTMPEGTRAVVFRASNRGIPVLIQSLTGDRGLLAEAVGHCVPVQARPVSSVYANAVDELHNLADYLRPVPGRKAVLWFAGRFPLYVQPNFGASASAQEFGQEGLTRAAFRALEAARIAVYPIDVRGVVMANLAYNPASDVAAAANDPSTTTKAMSGEAQQTGAGYNAMDQLAAATGGRAFYSENMIAKVMDDAVRTEEHTYAMSYRPDQYASDGRWHTIRISVDGPYRVSYRNGYYAGVEMAHGQAEVAAGREAASVRRPLPEGKPADAISADADAPPLIFEARVEPQAAASRRTSYGILYGIAASGLSFATAADGTHHARYRLAILAYNASGDILKTDVTVSETRYTDEQMTLAERIGVPGRATIEAPKGAEFLLLAVEDLRTGRVGTLQLTTRSAKQAAAAQR